MKRISRILCLAMILCLTLALYVPGASAANTAVQEAQQGVARVVIPLGEGYVQLGTCFFIGEEGKPVEYAITNCHVVTVEDNEGNVYLADQVNLDVYIVFDDFNVATTLKATIVQAFAVDLAILRLSSPTTLRKPLKLMPSSEVQVTDTVYAIGYPGVSDDYSGLVPGTIEAQTVTGPGSITKVKWVDSDGSQYLQHDVEINGGNSGGPLVNEEGYVVGINSRTASAAAATNQALYIDYAMDFFNTMGIGYMQAARTTPVPEATATPEPEPTAEPTPEPTAVPEPTATPEPTFGEKLAAGWYWILIAAVVVIGAILAIVLLRKKPAPAPAQPVVYAPVQPAAPTPQIPQGRQLVAMGNANPLSGKSFALRGTLVIGRDPTRCTVVFPPKTPGVSAEHCRVTETADGAELVDTGSSYGTFFDNGTKLTPNKAYQLHAGDVFFLASRDNGFTVK